MMVFSIYEGLFAGLLLLLAAALITPFFAGKRQLAGALSFSFCLAAGVLFALVSISVLSGNASGEPFVLSMGGVSIPFLIDGLSAIFLGLIALMSTLTAFYCIGYMEMDHYRHYGLGGFLFNFPVFIAGMVGIVSVDDLSVGFSIAWQAMTLASFFLIRFDRQDQATLSSANKYLLLMELAWVAIVAAAALIPHAGLGTPLHALTEGLAVADPGLRALVYGALLFGFGMKVGVFPLGQLWLPDAHSSAPSPISALMSGVMIKTGVYGIVRTLFWMVPPEAQGLEARHLGLILACFGVTTLFVGTVQSLKQNDAKRLLAYSSIGQMGYVLLAIGTAHWFVLSGNPLLQSLAMLALIGALYHTANHTLFKGLLFLSTGSVQYATGTKDLDRLGGLLKSMPVTALVAAIASVSIAGIPAFSGFASKWAIVASGLLGGKAAGIVVLFGVIALMTSAITLALTVKFYGMIFTSAGTEWSQKGGVREVGMLMLLPTSLIAALCLVQGLLPGFFIELFSRVFATSEGSLVQTLFADPATRVALTQSWAGVGLRLGSGSHPVAFLMPLALLAMLIVAGLFAAWLRRAGGAEQRQAPVWLCGYQTLNGANTYTSSHIYAAFKKLMWWTGGNERRA